MGGRSDRRIRDVTPVHDNVLGTTAMPDARRRRDHDCSPAPLLGEWPHLSFHHAHGGWHSSIYRPSGPIGGFVAYTYALRHLPVSFVSLYAYINPIIAVALGVIFPHESFDSRMAVAAALVFVGVAVVPLDARGPLRPHRRWMRAALSSTLNRAKLEPVPSGHHPRVTSPARIPPRGNRSQALG